MDIGYINFGTEEKNNLYKVIQSIRDHHAIDELGIGRIRDAFSNKMVPSILSYYLLYIWKQKKATIKL